MLEIGYNHSFEIRKEEIPGFTGTGFTILYLSDFHFNAYTKKIIGQLIETIRDLDPTIILLGGDYLDTPAGLTWLSFLLEAIVPGRLVYAIPGNHDRFWGLEKIKKTMLLHQVTWLDNSSSLLNIGSVMIRIDGGKPSVSATKADFHILFVHEPIDPAAYQGQYQLIFAGHLHGCQFVFWQTEKGLYPGRYFYKWNILKTKFKDCLYLISKGLGDTLPVRYNCKKDIIFVSVSNNL